jgi:hypothetical protein
MHVGRDSELDALLPGLMTPAIHLSRHRAIPARREGVQLPRLSERPLVRRCPGMAGFNAFMAQGCEGAKQSWRDQSVKVRPR